VVGVTAQLTLLPELEPNDFEGRGSVYWLTDWLLLKPGYSGRSRPDCFKQRSGELRGNIFGWLPGTKADERAIHDRLEPWRFAGEWCGLPTDPAELAWLLREMSRLRPVPGGPPPEDAFMRVLANNLRPMLRAA
jgi:hypothetical protein